MDRNRLIVIDDNPEIGDFIVAVARISGYEAKYVGSASEFGLLFATWSPTLIMLDLKMPEIDGVELLHYLADQQCKVPIVIMSGHDQKVIETARYLGTEYGLNIIDMLQKPFRSERLQEIFVCQGGCRGGGQDVEAGIIDEAAIRTAIDERQFRLVFQPKVALNAKPEGFCQWRTIGFEALLRWHHPQLGILAPAKFLPQAEALPLMDDLTALVIAEAVVQLARWRQDGLVTTLALNVSGANLESGRFADCLVAACRDECVPPETIIIELTETAAMADPVRAMNILARLRLKGFSLSIDDFGTGYSSLVQLQRLPFTELKIDRALIADCDISQQSRVIVKSAIDLAHNLGLTSCAEGIETASILEVVRQFGCDFAQGYHIARPMNGEQAGAWLRQGSGNTIVQGE